MTHLYYYFNTNFNYWSSLTGSKEAVILAAIVYGVLLALQIMISSVLGYTTQLGDVPL